MRLLNTTTPELEEFGSERIPPYAILSQTWREKEATLQDIKGHCDVDFVGYDKIKNTCSIAVADRFEYVWIDSCCTI
jgi:hypothetical protein